MGSEMLRCAQHDKGALSMIGLNLSIDEELLSSFEPCLNIERVRV
jgi:hypothetical protein